MENVARHIAQKLLQINAIKLSPQKPFTWASGILSPIYCDNRLTLNFPEFRTYIADAFAKVISEYNYDKIAGIATAGIPHGALLADKVQKPYLYVRSKAKGHGRQNMIEGVLNQDEQIIMVEDLISTGMSSLKAVDAIREGGGKTDLVLSIFNYGFSSAVEAFEAKKCNFVSLSNYDILLEEAVKIGHLEDKDLDLLKRWKTDPKSWNIN